MSGFTGVTENWIYNTPQGLQYQIDNKFYVTDGLVLDLDAANSLSYPGTGTTWTDLSGNGNNGTLVGPSYTTDNQGALVFDGVDDYVNFGNIFNDVFAGVDKKFTISAFVKYNNLLENGNVILAKSGDSNFGENQRQISFGVRNPSNAYGSMELDFFTYFALSVSSYTGYRTVNANIQTNQYYNFVISYDGSYDSAERFGLYVNGVKYAVTPTFTAGSWGDIQPGNARMSVGATIGEKVTNIPVGLLNGNIAQVQIYNRALSQAEVQHNFNVFKWRYGL